MGLGLGGQGAGQIGFTLGVQGVIGAPPLGNKEGRSIGLNACTCSYMSETGVTTVNARAHPALKYLGVKASIAIARRHMIYI